MIAQLIICSETRDSTLAKIKNTIKLFQYDGVKDNLSQLESMIENTKFTNGTYDATIGDRLNQEKLKRLLARSVTNKFDLRPNPFKNASHEELKTIILLFNPEKSEKYKQLTESNIKQLKLDIKKQSRKNGNEYFRDNFLAEIEELITDLREIVTTRPGANDSIDQILIDFENKKELTQKKKERLMKWHQLNQLLPIYKELENGFFDGLSDKNIMIVDVIIGNSNKNKRFELIVKPIATFGNLQFRVLIKNCECESAKGEFLFDIIDIDNSVENGDIVCNVIRDDLYETSLDIDGENVCYSFIYWFVCLFVCLMYSMNTMTTNTKTTHTN